MLANLIIAAATRCFLFRTAADGTQTVIPERFTVIAVVYGVCAVACYLLCYALCRERVQAAPPREAKRQSFASLAKALAGNRALTAVIGAALLLLLASLLGQGHEHVPVQRLFQQCGHALACRVRGRAAHAGAGALCGKAVQKVRQKKRPAVWAWALPPRRTC